MLISSDMRFALSSSESPLINIYIMSIMSVSVCAVYNMSRLSFLNAFM